MNNKLAFKIIKVLEMYALNKQKDTHQELMNNYELILMLPSGHYSNGSEWTLVLQPNTDWLTKERKKNTLNELYIHLKGKKLIDFSSENYIKRITIINNKDTSLKEITRFNDSFENGFKYFDRISNLELNGELIEEMFILKSKILNKIKFGQKIQLRLRQHEGYDNAYLNSYSNTITEHIIIGIKDYNLLALNDLGLEKYDANQALSNQEFLLPDEFTHKISLYDVFDVMPNAISELSKSVA